MYVCIYIYIDTFFVIRIYVFTYLCISLRVFTLKTNYESLSSFVGLCFACLFGVELFFFLCVCVCVFVCFFVCLRSFIALLW